jgi:hypothetical protein
VVANALRARALKADGGRAQVRATRAALAPRPGLF